MMKKLMMLAVVVGFAFFTVGQVYAEPIEIHWWHAMRGARGETLQKDGGCSSTHPRAIMWWSAGQQGQLR
jgi:ABC-type glycerol-3-phosphate transport system substrate-binding protein